MKISRNMLIGLALIIGGIVLFASLIVIGIPPANNEDFSNYYFSQSVSGTGRAGDAISLHVTGRIFYDTELQVIANFKSTTWLDAEYKIVIYTSADWAGFSYYIFSTDVNPDMLFEWEIEENWYPNDFDARHWIQGSEKLPPVYGNVEGIVTDFSVGSHPLQVKIYGYDESNVWTNFLTWSGIILHKTVSDMTGVGYELSFNNIQPSRIFYSDSTVLLTLGGIATCLVIAGVVFIKFKE